jgi:ABC-type dipeptide/oligopeptide/nickel transport system permease subunit
MPITGLLGGLFLLVVVLAAILAPIVTVYDPNKIDTAKQLASPSISQWFGTDQVGRDIFSRIIFGARYTLGASLVVCLIAALPPPPSPSCRATSEGLWTWPSSESSTAG